MNFQTNGERSKPRHTAEKVKILTSARSTDSRTGSGKSQSVTLKEINS